MNNPSKVFYAETGILTPEAIPGFGGRGAFEEFDVVAPLHRDRLRSFGIASAPAALQNENSSVPQRVESVSDLSLVYADYTYDADGNRVESSDAGADSLEPTASQGRYVWTGREEASTLDLLYTHARYCDPKVGRWISGDPLGYDAGDSDLFKYARPS